MARSFNGTTDKIDLTNNGNISSITGTNARSFSAWINPSSLANTGTVFGYGANTTDNSCTVTTLNTNAIQMGFTGDNIHTTTTPLGTSSWQHIAITYNGTATSTSSVLIYYNGAAQATVQGGSPGTPNTTNANFAIGYAAFASSTFFTGNIADVGAWNIVLTAAEILALANGARPYNIRNTTLVGWWPVDGLQSPEPDISGIKNNGTLTGTARVAAGPPVMMLTPRRPIFISAVAAAAPSFQAAWAMRNRIIVEGIGI